MKEMLKATLDGIDADSPRGRLTFRFVESGANRSITLRVEKRNLLDIALPLLGQSVKFTTSDGLVNQLEADTGDE